MALSWGTRGYVSFTRVLAHRPMFTAPYGKERNDNPGDGNQLDRLAEWSEAIDAWRRHWARARARATTVILERRSAKAHAAHNKRGKMLARRRQEGAPLLAILDAMEG